MAKTAYKPPAQPAAADDSVFVLDLGKGPVSRWEAHRLLDAFLLRAETRRLGDPRLAAEALGMDLDPADPAGGQTPTPAAPSQDPFVRRMMQELP